MSRERREMNDAASQPERGFAHGRFELKAAASGAAPDGSFSGHGALFDTLCPTSSWMLPMDWQDEFKAGAFAKSIEKRKKNGGLFPACWQHDLDCPVGAYPVVQEDKTGLWCEGRLALKTAKGAETYELMQIGAVSGLSVQYIPTIFELDEKRKVRSLVEVDLIEIAPCTVPNMDGARVADVKTSRPEITKRYLERVLRDAGLGRDEAKAFIAKGFGAIDELRDADASGLLAAVQNLTQTIRKAG